MKFVIVLALLAVVTAVPSFKFDEFKKNFNKSYSSAHEEIRRFKIFVNNVQKIEAHNKRHENGLETYKLGVNKFTDLTFGEFKARYLGFKGQRHAKSHIKSSVDVKSLPQSIDWRQQGIVAPIKDQGQCGSCWAFSAIAAVESANAQATGKLVQLSEQNVMDCSSSYGDQSCEGGLMDWAFQYIIDNKGVDTETSYPYEAMDDICRFTKQNVGGSISKYVNITAGDEKQLQAAAAKGVVSVAIEASMDFQFYAGGVFNTPCEVPAQLDHGVAVVGYGTEDGQDYWIVRNSWGVNWGEQGYVRMARNQDLCGIVDAASYPIV